MEPSSLQEANNMLSNNPGQDEGDKKTVRRRANRGILSKGPDQSKRNLQRIRPRALTAGGGSLLVVNEVPVCNAEYVAPSAIPPEEVSVSAAAPERCLMPIAWLRPAALWAADIGAASESGIAVVTRLLSIPAKVAS